MNLLFKRSAVCSPSARILDEPKISRTVISQPNRCLNQFLSSMETSESTPRALKDSLTSRELTSLIKKPNNVFPISVAMYVMDSSLSKMEESAATSVRNCRSSSLPVDVVVPLWLSVLKYRAIRGSFLQTVRLFGAERSCVERNPIAS